MRKRIIIGQRGYKIAISEWVVNIAFEQFKSLHMHNHNDN